MKTILATEDEVFIQAPDSEEGTKDVKYSARSIQDISLIIPLLQQYAPTIISADQKPVGHLASFCHLEVMLKITSLHCSVMLSLAVVSTFRKSSQTARCLCPVSSARAPLHYPFHWTAAGP